MSQIKKPEKRAKRSDKTASVLLKIAGKSVSLEVYPSELWRDQPGAGPGLFRLRLDGTWIMEAGKYTFYSRDGIKAVVARLMDVEMDGIAEPVQPALPVKRQVVCFKRPYKGMRLPTRAMTPAFLGADGRYHIFVCGLHEPVPVDCLEFITHRNHS